MEAIKVWFPMHNQGDLLVAMGAGTIGVAGVPVIPMYLPLVSQFWIEENADGVPRLCSFKTDGSLLGVGTPGGPASGALTGQFIDITAPPGTPPYICNALPFVAVQVGDKTEWKPQ